MIDKVRKIREDVEKLKSQLLRGACSSQVAMETRCKEEAYNEVLTILDTLQDEPVSEDLEYASEKYSCRFSSSKYGHNKIKSAFKAGAKWKTTIVSEDFEEIVKNLWNEINSGHEYSVMESYNVFYGLCLDIANWQKEQMMSKAIEGYVIEDIEEGNGDFLLSADYLPKNMGLKGQQKVKVIVIKED